MHPSFRQQNPRPASSSQGDGQHCKAGTKGTGSKEKQGTRTVNKETQKVGPRGEGPEGQLRSRGQGDSKWQRRQSFPFGPYGLGLEKPKKMS